MKKVISGSLLNPVAWWQGLKAFCKKTAWFLASHAFLVVVVLVLLDVVFGEFLLYRHLNAKIKDEQMYRPVAFQEAKYQSILLKWKEREQAFTDSITREYQDPF